MNLGCLPQKSVQFVFRTTAVDTLFSREMHICKQKKTKEKEKLVINAAQVFFDIFPACRLCKGILFQKFIGCYLFSTCQINICAFLSLGRQIYWAGYQLPRMSYSYVCCDWNLIHLRAPGRRDKIEQKSIYKQIRTNLKAFIVIYFVAA